MGFMKKELIPRSITNLGYGCCLGFVIGLALAVWVAMRYILPLILQVFDAIYH